MDVREDRTLLADTPLRAVAYTGTILRGNGGDDRLTAKRAKDSAYGGPGRDVFRVAKKVQAHSCEVVRVAG